MEAVTAIQRLVGELPELSYLNYILDRAKAAMRRRTWTPLQPKALLNWVQDQQADLVQNAAPPRHYLYGGQLASEPNLNSPNPGGSSAAIVTPVTHQGEAPAMTNTAPVVDVAILTVLPEEYQAVLNRLVNPRRAPPVPHYRNLYNWQLGSIPTSNGNAYSVILGMQGRAAEAPAALATTETIRSWQPQYLLFVGIAGGLPLDDLQKGDVVFANTIYGYEYGKIERVFHPRPDWLFRTDLGLFNIASHLAMSPGQWAASLAPREGQRPPKALPGHIASGDKVVDNPSNEFFQQVLQFRPKLHAIEMEGAGAGLAIEQAKAHGQAVGFLMIRGLSDMPRPPAEGETQGTEERDAWKLCAAEAAAAFTIALIAGGLPIPPLATAVATAGLPTPQAETRSPTPPLAPPAALPAGTTGAGTTPTVITLRQLLNQRLDDAQLDAFCLDHYPVVFDRFAAGMRRDAKITLLLDYCRRQENGLVRLQQILNAAQG